jgi:hypothetical protein
LQRFVNPHQASQAYITYHGQYNSFSLRSTCMSQGTRERGVTYEPRGETDSFLPACTRMLSDDNPWRTCPPVCLYTCLHVDPVLGIIDTYLMQVRVFISPPHVDDLEVGEREFASILVTHLKSVKMAKIVEVRWAQPLLGGFVIGGGCRYKMERQQSRSRSTRSVKNSASE